MSAIWQPLARVRRRITRGRRRMALSERPGGGADMDLTFALNRADLERLIGALTHVPGVDPGRPDTPARLEAALRIAIAQASGSGSPAVTHRPAGIYTPETWQIEVLGADRRTQLTLERVLQGGGVA